MQYNAKIPGRLSLAPDFYPAIVFDQPVQKSRDQAQHNRAKQGRCPGMDNESWRNSRCHLEQDGVDHDQEQAEGEDRQWKGDDFQNQAERGVYQSEDDGCDQRCAEAVQFKARNNVSAQSAKTRH